MQFFFTRLPLMINVNMQISLYQMVITELKIRKEGWVRWLLKRLLVPNLWISQGNHDLDATNNTHPHRNMGPGKMHQQTPTLCWWAHYNCLTSFHKYQSEEDTTAKIQIKHCLKGGNSIGGKEGLERKFHNHNPLSEEKRMWQHANVIKENCIKHCSILPVKWI